MDIIRGAKKIKSMSLLKTLVEDRGYAIIDVRSPLEYRYGTLLEAPNSAVRNFVTIYANNRANTAKFVFIGSTQSMEDLEMCIRYANNFPQPDKKQQNLRFVIYDELMESENK